MVWLLVIPCIVAALISTSYDDVVVPIIGLFAQPLEENAWFRLLSVVPTTIVFLALVYFANKRSFSAPHHNHWAWYPLIGNTLLASIDFAGEAFDFQALYAFKLPLLLAILLMIAFTALNVGSAKKLTKGR